MTKLYLDSPTRTDFPSHAIYLKISLYFTESMINLPLRLTHLILGHSFNQ